MAERLFVELPVLDGSAQDVSGLAEWMRTGLGALDQQITGLVGASWSGDASSEYSKVWQQWHEGGASLISGWSAFAEWMAMAEKAFREVSGS